MFWVQLLSTLSDDERDFVTDLYEKYKDEMYRTAYAILKNRHDAEDAVNDIMLAVIRNIDKYDGQDDNVIRNQIVVYMRCIIRNISINTYNKRKRIRSQETDMFSYDADADEYKEIDYEDKDYSLENNVISSAELEDVMKLISQLSPEMQDTIYLVCLNGYTSKEAAMILGTTPEAVRFRVHSVRKKIKKMMKEMCYD